MAKIRKRYNQAPHLTQETNEKVATSQLDITHESQDVSPFPAGDHKAPVNRRARKHNKTKTNLSLAFFYWKQANSADPDQKSQNTASNQYIHCLFIEWSFKILKKKNNTKIPCNTPKWK